MLAPLPQRRHRNRRLATVKGLTAVEALGMHLTLKDVIKMSGKLLVPLSEKGTLLDDQLIHAGLTVCRRSSRSRSGIPLRCLALLPTSRVSTSGRERPKSNESSERVKFPCSRKFMEELNMSPLSSTRSKQKRTSYSRGRHSWNLKLQVDFLQYFTKISPTSSTSAYGTK